jgi:hypothetical protein
MLSCLHGCHHLSQYAHIAKPAFSMTTLLPTYCDAHILEDHLAPSSLAGEVILIAAFYERGLSLLPSIFLRGLLLLHYGLKLHHLTPSGVLHIAAFVTLCEAFLGLLPHFML